jgi:hypothetical protein
MTFIMKKGLPLCLLFLSSLASAQEGSDLWNKMRDDYKVKVSLGFQIWSTYTISQELYDNEQLGYVSVDNRLNTQIRRSRLSITGQPYERLKFKLTASLDLVGRDVNTATQGGSNNGNMPAFGLWNLYLQWSPLHADYLHITGGYQPPQIGRESITAALRSTSFEKSWSQNYLRRTLVGRGPGRAMGLNIGGQKSFTSDIHMSYDVGVFSPQAFTSISNSQGIKASLLWTSRFVFFLGDPESSSYTLSHKVNYFGQRNGLSIAAVAAYQGDSDLFDSNKAYGFDILFNRGMINIDGEWTWLERTGGSVDESIAVPSHTGYARVGYNIPLNNGAYVEPVLMYVWFNGPTSFVDQGYAQAVGAFAGQDEIWDFGVNYHINQNLKISVSYTKNWGSSGDSVEAPTFNNYFRNSDKAPIMRGDLIGLAVVAIF